MGTVEVTVIVERYSQGRHYGRDADGALRRAQPAREGVLHPRAEGAHRPRLRRVPQQDQGALRGQLRSPAPVAGELCNELSIFYFMTQVGLDYLHGTGHGVGAFLNVHEVHLVTK